MVVEPDDPDGVEIVLEPNAPPPAAASQKALYENGFPAALLTTATLQADYERLRDLGVVFRGEPDLSGPVPTVFFEDGCGNLINLAQA